MQAIIKGKWCFKENKGAKGAVRGVKIKGVEEREDARTARR